MVARRHADRVRQQARRRATSTTPRQHRHLGDRRARPARRRGRLTTSTAPTKRAAVVEPDGKQIAYLAGEELKYSAYNQNKLAVIPAAGGQPRFLAESLDRPVRQPPFVDGGRLALRSSSSTTARSTPRASPATGGKRRAARRRRSASSTACRPVRTMARFAVLASTRHEPPEVAALENGKLRRLSHQNDEWLSKRAARHDRGIHAHEQGRHRGARPDRQAGDVPGRAQVSDAAAHPRRPERPGRARVQLRARALRRQRLRRRRGELSRQQRPRQRLPEGDLRRLGQQGSRRPARRRWTTSRSWPTPIADRLGIGGWSYGGILTDYTIATDGRFKAATSGAGSALQLSMYGVDKYITQYQNEIGPPWKITGPVDQDLVSVLPRRPDQDADAVPGRREGLQRAARRRRADVPGAAEPRRRHAARDLPGPVPRHHDAELQDRSARALRGLVRQVPERPARVDDRRATER